MLKKFLIGTFALALMLTVVAKTEAFSGVTLKVGSRGADVMELQTLVGATPVDGVFGPMTKAKVMAWQASNGLTADGVFGPMSIAKASAGTTGGTLPAGCTSTTGFSSTTGQSCAATTTTLPAGCMSTVGYSSTTGAKCDGSTTPAGDNGPLVGGAGDVTISSTSSDVEDKIKESDEDAKVLGFQVEAEDSDVAVTSLKVILKNTSYTVSSEKLTDYVDSVTIFMGSTEVGSADASDFSKETGTPDEYSKSITLSNAVVREGDKTKFYVAVSSVSNVDSDDMDADWDVLADTLRFQDATGVIMTADVGENNVFTFEDASTDDSLEVKSWSSANPDDVTVAVDATDTTDDVLGLAFKMDVDQDSADVTVTSMKITVDVTNFDGSDVALENDNGTVDANDDINVADGAQPTWVERIVDSVMVDIDGTEYEADLDDAADATAADVVDGDGTVTYTVTFEDEEMVIDSGDVAEAKVMFNFNDQDGNYNEGVTVTASLDSQDDIEAETENDELSIDGSGKTGAELTLSLSTATVTGITWEALEGGAGIELTFKVEAEDDSVDVTLAALQAADTVTTTGTVGAPTLTKVSGTATDNGGNSWTVGDGDNATFSLVYTNTGANGTSVRVTMPTIAGQSVPEDKEVSPLVVRNVN